MISREDYLIIKLGEECNEVAQRVTKALTFGLEEIQTGQDESNRERIMGEVNDLLGILKMLQDEGFLPEADKQKINAKKDKVEKYYKYSQLLGIVKE